MNVAMTNLICVECGSRHIRRQGSGPELGVGPAGRGGGDGAFGREFREDGQIEQIERNFGRDWKW